MVGEQVLKNRLQNNTSGDDEEVRNNIGFLASTSLLSDLIYIHTGSIV